MSAIKVHHYRKPLWIPTNQNQPTYKDINERRLIEQQQLNPKLKQSSLTSNRSSLLWHSRVDQESGRLPPVLGTSTDGTPIFAFLGNGRLATKKAKREAINFYRQFVNEHFGDDPTNEEASPACIYRICCNQEPDFTFEYVSATWDFNQLKISMKRKLHLGLAPKTVQEMFNKHGCKIDYIDIQWVEGVPHIKYPNDIRRSKVEEIILLRGEKKGKKRNHRYHNVDVDEDEDVFDFCETLSKHLKSVGKNAIKRLHKREEMAAVKLQARWRAKNGQLVAHMKKRLLAQQKEEDEKVNGAARRIQAAWRRKTGQMAAHLLKKAK
jgi:hypothetical protein